MILPASTLSDAESIATIRRALEPAVDIDAKLPPQILDENVVTIIEKWESLEALRDHLEAPHMLAYREKVKNIVAGLSLKVLREA